jgi:hypothetical protein
MMMDGLYGYAQNIRFINLETIKAGDEIESGVFHHSYFFLVVYCSLLGVWRLVVVVGGCQKKRHKYSVVRCYCARIFLGGFCFFSFECP